MEFHATHSDHLQARLCPAPAWSARSSTRFEAKGLRIAALKLIQVDRALAEKHYAEHQGKPFFEGLIEFITSGPVVVGVLEGNEAIAVVRTMLGATNGVAAAPGTVRGDFSISKQNNLVHGSDSPESAQREIALWFRPERARRVHPGRQRVGLWRRVSRVVESRARLDEVARHEPSAAREPMHGRRTARRMNPVFANPFYVVLMVVSTLFVLTALGYLVSPNVIEPRAGSRHATRARWRSRPGSTATVR